ncbi:MAG TPA: kelch repeat-containing protein, partial [Archangium sp.]
MIPLLGLLACGESPPAPESQEAPATVQESQALGAGREATSSRGLAAEAWQATPNDEATLELAEAYFPEFFQAEAPGTEATRLDETALQVTLPAEAGGVMEISTRGYLFQVREDGSERGPAARASGGAAFYGSSRFWKPVGASRLEGERRWRTRRAEEFLILAQARGEHRARYEITVPEGVVRVRDAGSHLEFLDASERPVVRMHSLVVRDRAGLSREGQMKLLGSTPLESPSARRVVVELTVSLEGLTGPVVIDPAWSSTGDMITARTSHSAVLLPSGKVLVVGGKNDSAYLNKAELYDPTTATWSAAADLRYIQTGATALLLPSGKVLVAGGSQSTSATELYDPATNTWSLTGPMTGT